MEGLRGVAVFLVFWVHYSSLIAPWVTGYSIHISGFLHSLGHLGVDLFFVLSGYLIYGSIIGKPSFSTSMYAKRRVQRIYPVFLVVFAIYIMLSFIFPSESKLPEGYVEIVKYILQNLLLLPGVFNIEPLITVAWSLSYEAFYYLVIPCLIFVLKMKSWSVKSRVIFWVIVSIIGFSASAVWGGPARLLMFISGILLYEAYKNKNIILHKGGISYMLIALIVFGLRSIFEINYTFSLLAVFILFLLLCLCAFNVDSKAYKLLTYAPLRWLGNMSYSYYLIHGLTLKFSFLILGYFVSSTFSSSTLYYWLWVPLLAMTLVASFFLFMIVERPFSLGIRAETRASKKQAPQSYPSPAQIDE